MSPLLKAKAIWTKQIEPNLVSLKIQLFKYYTFIKIKLHPFFHKFSRTLEIILKKSGIAYLWKMVHRFGSILLSGIQAKLAVFTGSLISLTIIFLSMITVNQQTSILTESYDKQAAISRNYITSLVTNLDNITQNLIQIEEFRLQISEQRSARRKYKRVSHFQVEKKVNFFGFKTNLFGVMGKENLRRVQDSFYSMYLSDSDLSTLESKIKEQLNISAGRNLTETEWKALQILAKKVVLSERNSKEEVRSSEQSNLEHKVASYIIESKRKNIEELGLDTHRFRMQTFPISRLSDSTGIKPSFDTKIFNQESNLAQLEDISMLDDSIRDSYNYIIENPISNYADSGINFQWNGLEIQSIYSPIFKYPESTLRARNILIIQEKLITYKDYISKDREIANNIAELYPKIRSRLESLRKRKPPIPPYRDKEFIAFYKEYNNLIEQREKEFDSLIEKFSIKDQEFQVIESLRSIRDSSMEDSILLRYRTDTSSLEQYSTDPEFRENYRKRWKSLRLWVSEARSETPTNALIKLFPDATIGKSRSEAEEIIWSLDSNPLFPVGTESLATTILNKNLTGIIRTLVDRTDGINLIRENRNYIILSALIIGILSILFAVFISGVVVQKIKRIIASAEDVGHGDLQVEFEFGGNDEFGKLTIALNQMVSGLREREKIKGILGSMIDPVVVSEAMKDLQALKRGSEKNITAFFSDIASFSTISEKLSSPELADLLNEYLSAMTIILKNNGGVLDKYIGDAIVGIFNSPIDVPDHTYKAVIASIEMQEKLVELKQKWKQENKYIPEAREMTFRIGLNTGLAKVGFMGTDELASYTMMGDTVNLAARLEAAGKDYGVNILVTDSVEKEIHGKVFVRKLDVVRVKGKSEPVTLYEVICKNGEESKAIQISTEYYEKGLDAYLQKNWSEATNWFLKSLDERKTPDKSSDILISRCEEYSRTPPPENWDGVYTRTNK
jgi:adenylate cyclase